MAAWPEIELIDDRRGNQFKVIVRRPAQQTGELNERVNEGVNEGVARLFAQIKKGPGLRAPMLAVQMNTSVKNIERWLQQLKDQQKVEFRGAPKTGGYYLKQ